MPNPKTIKEIKSEFEKMPLCYDDGIIENENDSEFIRGQAHFKNHYQEFLGKALPSLLEEVERRSRKLMKFGITLENCPAFQVELQEIINIISDIKNDK